MKSLVLYYSNNGYTMEIAEEIAENVGADMERIIPVKDIITKGNHFSISLMILFGETPKILDLNKDLNEYDLIFIGTPVWFGSYVPFIRTLLSRRIFKGKNIGVFCCCDKTSGGTLKNMRKKLKTANVIDELEISQKEGNYVNVHKAKEWAKSLYGKVERMEY